MENKKKIWAAVAAIVIIVVLALVFVLGGKDNTTVADTDVVETITTEVVTVEGTESNGESAVVDNIDYLAGITEAPEDNSGDEVIENETIKDFVDETDNKVEDTKDETSTSESSEDVSVIEPGVVEEPTNPTNGNEGNGDANVEPNLGGDNGNGGNETTPVETPPAVEPEPTTPVTPPSSGNGDNLSFSGSTTLPSGLTINTLNEFNHAGKDTSAGNSFMGDIYSDIVAQNYETMADNFDAFNQTYNSAINVTNGEQIWWRSSMADSSASIELRRAGDHYKLIISSPLLDDATAESLGWMSGREAEAREALTVLLSAITSQPTTVQESIIASLYTAPAGQEPIGCDGNWYNIGDCQIALDLNNTNNISTYVFTFMIR